ncbi:fibronectin type III domain-containing protein, partial [Riemerella anatipestifer]|uniref:fibronectin type III domain-containing protein n=1 Tax=Riemerella anatipestifer TaxID=34085 RepID=UPI00161F4D5E
YYAVVESRDAASNTSSSTERSFTTLAPAPADTTAPTILSISIVPSSTSAVVSWTTNEAANSKVHYGTSSPVNPASSSSTSDSALVTNPSITLTGLTASTTYYAILTSADAAGNTATSSEQAFTTFPLPDTTAPIISGIDADAATTTATVSWNTNESATSKIYYSLTTP